MLTILQPHPRGEAVYQRSWLLRWWWLSSCRIVRIEGALTNASVPSSSEVRWWTLYARSSPRLLPNRPPHNHRRQFGEHR